MTVVHIGHHFYGAGNLGDDLMLRGFLDAWASAGRTERLSCCSPFDLGTLRRRFPQVDWRSYDANTREQSIRECRAWLGLGGSPFQSDCGPWFLEHLAEEQNLCRRLAKPMYFLGVGVGDHAALADNRTKMVLDAAEHVWARDAQSCAWLAEVCGSSKVSCGADLSHIYLRRCPPRTLQCKTVGLLLHFENVVAFSPTAVRNVLQRAAQSRHYWLVQEVRSLPGSERTLLSSLPPEVKSKFEVCAPNYASDSIEQMLNCWPACEARITSRYHGGVVGAWLGSRVLIVERNDKLAGLAAQFSMRSLTSFTDADDILGALAETQPVSRSALELCSDQATSSCLGFFEKALKRPNVVGRLFRAAIRH